MTSQWNIFSQLSRMERKLNLLLAMETYEMTKISDLQDAVAAERTVSASVITLLNDINQRLKDAIASGDPAALDAVVADITNNTKALSDAVVANTPASG
jgi:hypothetical protein